MRDIVLTIMVFGSIPFILKKPYIGIIVWSWLSYMNPHRLTYGFAFDMPFAQIIAIVLFISSIASNEKKKIPINSITVVWIIFIIWMGITTKFAYYPDDAWQQYIKIIKIQIITFLTMILITNIERLRYLIWIIVLSIGFFSIKGGIYTIATGGSGRVWGPPGGFIAENNALAVAVLMTIALMVYLRKIYDNNLMKIGLLTAIVLSFFTVLGTQSRGALLAIVAVGLFFGLKSQHKFATTIVVAVFAVFLLAFMPESWYARMYTIESYEQDGSAMGRLNSWQYAINAANDNLTGVGLESWDYETFAIYAPDPDKVHAAHSIYFSVLADHGWIGLFMFLFIFGKSWTTLSKIIKRTKRNLDLYEFNTLSRLLQVGFIAYFVGGAFLSLSYFDLPWHFVSFVILVDKFLKEEEDKIEKNVQKIN